MADADAALTVSAVNERIGGPERPIHVDYFPFLALFPWSAVLFKNIQALHDNRVLFRMNRRYLAGLTPVFTHHYLD